MQDSIKIVQLIAEIIRSPLQSENIFTPTPDNFGIKILKK